MQRTAIALGGAAGALARHGTTVLLAPLLPGFPWATLAVNASGAALLGFLMQLLPGTSVRPATRAGLTIGFCGGFTTMSTFACEAVALARDGRTAVAAAYVGGSLLLGILAIAAGMMSASLLVRRRSPPRSPHPAGS